MSDRHHPRPDLAARFVKRLLHPDALGTGIRDGLFLAGAHGIGKTSFLQNDLIPALEQEGALVISAELGAGSPFVTPQMKALRAIRRALRQIKDQTAIKTACTQTPSESLLLPFDPDDVGKSDGTTLCYAFWQGIDRLGRNIFLILDDVDLLNRTPAGEGFLRSLKAARDAVNLRCENEKGTYLLIIGVGSHRASVQAMTSKPSRAFFGADREVFPTIDDGFVSEALAVTCFPADAVQTKRLLQAFDELGRRPRDFVEVLAESVNIASLSDAESLEHVFETALEARVTRIADRALTPILSDDTVTQALFTEFALAGSSPVEGIFSSAFITGFSRRYGLRPVSASDIRNALDRLLEADLIRRTAPDDWQLADIRTGQEWLRGDDRCGQADPDSQK